MKINENDIIEVRQMSLEQIEFELDYMIMLKKIDIATICSAAMSLLKVAEEGGVRFFIGRDGDLLPIFTSASADEHLQERVC